MSTVDAVDDVGLDTTSPDDVVVNLLLERLGPGAAAAARQYHHLRRH